MRKLAGVLVAFLLFAGVAFAGAFPDGPGGPKIAVLNRSTVLTDAQVAAAVPAFQKYLDQVCAAWHCAGTLYFTPNPVGARDWAITVNDKSSIPGAIGYHDLVKVPIGWVSAATAAANGVQWTEVFTHELAEMLVDANIALWSRHAKVDRFYALEVCDPVQGRTYTIDGVTVADYVYRSWFTENASGPYDSMRSLSAPFQLWTDGWAIIYQDGHETTIGDLAAAGLYGDG
ncbi:MAG TPA: hypothetical protein VNN79_03340 [Actinomycetota bacterium]|nr:hypothetical protein [Actinomycetota bacterium]